MDWTRLLTEARFRDPGYVYAENRPSYVQDADRILFSAPFRRLANKTQVHPLYENDHVHHRLIHSVETGSVGRSLGMEAGAWLEGQGALAPGARHLVAGAVQAACLCHDIGNPPFGHSGESAIGAWFARKFDENQGLFAELDPALRGEFEKFEGNAQGFRIIARREMYRDEGGMRLSAPTLGAFSKYPAAERVARGRRGEYCGLKKYGLFAEDVALYAEVAETLGLPQQITPEGPWWRRHPLVFLVEAADDICYRILDIEDAHTMGEIDYDRARALLTPLLRRIPSDRGREPHEELALLRALAIGEAIGAASEAFRTHHDAILAGTFSGALIEVSALAPAWERIDDVTRKRILTGPRKTRLEVEGRNVLHRVLDGLAPVFEALAARGWEPERLGDYHGQLVSATALDLRGAKDAYSALHLLADYVSGMTDRYAVSVAKMLSGG